jgi:hypothetical protein
VMKTVVQRALGRRERHSALDASVSATFSGLRPVESVSRDVSGSGFPV